MSHIVGREQVGEKTAVLLDVSESHSYQNLYLPNREQQKAQRPATPPSGGEQVAAYETPLEGGGLLRGGKDKKRRRPGGESNPGRSVDRTQGPRRQEAAPVALALPRRTERNYRLTTRPRRVHLLSDLSPRWKLDR